jgi:methionyl-tRNA formyltransferase
MRIVFFGTPEFAVPSLEALLAERAQVVGVVTQPDKPHGRSRSSLVPPPVKLAALRRGLPVLQPDRPRGDLFLASLRHWQPEIGVVVAYGHILRPEVLSLPSRGMINVHASLLPRFRGASPINWAILEGDSETGISIMAMEPGMDTGPILHRSVIPVGPMETAGTLTERLAALAADTLVEALALLRLGGVAPVPQDDARASYAPKIGRTVTRVAWQGVADAVSRSIRAFDPQPGAWSTLGGHEIKLFGARAVPGAGVPGTVLSVTPSLTIATGLGAVQINEVKPSGKARMPAQDWARGRGAAAGEVFE